MYTTFLSWRYLVSRRTNWIAVAGIGVGVAALVLILSIMTGFLDENRRILRGELADVIVAPIHLGRRDGREVPRDPDRILAVIRSDPRVVAATGELLWGGMIVQTGENAATSEVVLSNMSLGDLPLVQLLGIDPGEVGAATDFEDTLEDVRDPSLRVADRSRPFDPPPGFTPVGRPLKGVVVGESLLRQLQIERGEIVQLFTVVPDPASGEVAGNNARFVVSGAFRTAENALDAERVYLQRSDLEDLVGGSRGFSQVVVKVADYERDGPALARDLRLGLDWLGLTRGVPPEVKTWEDVRERLIGAIENERALLGVIVALVLLVAGFTVFAILSMMVTEKRRDIGILTALGGTPRGVTGLFLLIAFWDALLGALGGALAGVYAARHIDAFEQWLTRTSGQVASWFGADWKLELFRRDIYVFSFIPTRTEPAAVAAIVVGAFVCTLLFAAIPAWRASRIDPLEALRYE